MNTAEKRAELEAKGEPWPKCECHGEPMGWNRRPRKSSDGFWKCKATAREKKRQGRAERRAAGKCEQCGEDAVTETMCRSCADAHADLMAQPYQRWRHLLAQSRHRAAGRVSEGFQPTEVGMAAIAAAMYEKPYRGGMTSHAIARRTKQTSSGTTSDGGSPDN